MDKTSEPLALAAEAQSVQDVSPHVDDLRREFGADSYHESADGEWRVDIRRPDLTQEENDRRGRKFIDMSRQRVSRASEVSEAREARRGGDVAVVSPAGDVQVIPARRENGVAMKAGFRPVIKYGRRRRRYRIEDINPNPSAPLRTWAEIQEAQRGDSA